MPKNRFAGLQKSVGKGLCRLPGLKRISERQNYAKRFDLGHDLLLPVSYARQAAESFLLRGKDAPLKRELVDVYSTLFALDEHLRHKSDRIRYEHMPWQTQGPGRGELFAFENLARECNEKIEQALKQAEEKGEEEVVDKLKKIRFDLGRSQAFLAGLREKGFVFREKVERINAASFVERSAKRIAQEQIEIRNLIPGDFSVGMDRLDLHACVLNLVKNSIEHNPGYPVQISAKRIRGNARKPDTIFLEFLTKGGKKQIPREIIEKPEAVFSSTGKEDRGRGTAIISGIMNHYGGELVPENTREGPKFTLKFKSRLK